MLGATSTEDKNEHIVWTWPPDLAAHSLLG